MKKLVLLIFVHLLFAHTGFSQNQEGMSPKQFIEDLEYLKSELPKRHTNLFAKISEKEFHSKIAAIELKSSGLTNESFEIELYKLFREIGDEHTRLEPTYREVFPLKFDFFREGIFVTHTASAYTGLLGKRLDGIENTPTKALIGQFEKMINTENPAYFDTYFQHLVTQPRVLKGLGITPAGASAHFLLDDSPYAVSAVKKENLSLDASAAVLKNSQSDHYWYRLTDNGEVLYFNYQKCAEQEGKPFEDFNNDLWQLIESKKPKRIIVDLRNNSGGNSGILNPFLDRLGKSYLNQKGRLYVLIGKSTFSSALMNAVNLKRNFQSVLVGQSTSGNVNHYGETRGFQLPNSRVTVGYSTRYWEVWKGYEGALKPDVIIEYSIKNFTNGVDEAIEYVRNQK